MKLSPNRRTRQNNKKTNRLKYIIPFIFILLIGSSFFATNYFKNNAAENNEQLNENNNPVSENDFNDNNLQDGNLNENDKSRDEVEETFTDVRIAAAGDIMFHSPQLTSGKTADGWDFKPMFKDVKPILSAADMTIANFETTVSGIEPYTGYPLFNSPDEVIDAIKDAGVDVLTTANNHSLDTRDTGLKRTVETIRSKGIDTVGTYSEQPESRVLMKDVKGINFAILAYTESTNGLGAQYPDDQLHGMINMMEKERIIADINEAKELNADFIITFMHWGDEYVRDPNDKQREFAQLMADEGVDLILGSHPHVIQDSEIITTADKQTYVIYSMGNFISNQRRETLGDNFSRTEDGIIINFDIRKNDQTKETTIQNVEYVPTWVYRHQEPGKSALTYRILPIENFLIGDEISDAYKARMERSFEATVSKMIENPFD